MSFLHPEFLYYMLPPLFILFGLLLTQKEAQANFFSDEVMRKLRVSANTLTLKARNALFMLMGVLLVVALAGPVIKEGTIEVKAKSADIMIALDISDSMLATDVYPNRLKLAKQKALELLKLAPNERIGVIAFAKNSYLVSPLSFDHDAVGFLLRQLSTDSITEKGTDFLSMLEVVARSVKEDAKKYLLILSDGGDKKDFSKEIAYAKEHGIVVFVLGVGTPQGAPIKLANGEFIKKDGKIIVTKLNDAIAQLATQTGGVYIQSVNADADVRRMLQEIEQHATKKELKSEKIEKYIPLFYYPLGLALLILLIATSSMTKREKVEVPSALLLFGLMMFSPDAKAGLFDFAKLQEAKEAYEAQKYEKAAKIYEEYANTTGKHESYYNEANALYKQGKYKEALQKYQKAKLDTPTQRARNFANMGNAYAKMPNEENLKKAIKEYERSLKIEDDKDVRENLEAVKKALEQMKKQKQKQKQQNKNQNKQNKQKQDKKNQQKGGDKKEQNKNSQDQKKPNKDQKQNKNDKQQNQQNKQNKQNSSQNDDKKQKPQDKKKNNDMKSKKPAQDKQKNADNQKKKGKEQSKKDTSQQKENKSSLEELKKKQNQNGIAQMKKEKMSDAEEKKWLKHLNAQQNTFLYMLNDPRKAKKENNNEVPW